MRKADVIKKLRNDEHYYGDFGKKYLSYKLGVPRWFPRISPYQNAIRIRKVGSPHIKTISES